MKVLTWVWHDCDVTSHTELLVMLALADEADDDGGSCFPSIRRLAAKARLSVGGVHKVLDRIEADERIVIDRPDKPAPGRHNRYQILVPWSVDDRSPGEQSDGEPFTEGSELFTTVHPKSERTLRPLDLPIEKTNAQSVIDAEFSTWWETVVWRKVGKGQAIRAWRAARKKTDADTLTDAAFTYRAQTANDDPEYQKHPATWLNGECWLDEPPPKATTAGERALAKIHARSGT